MLFVAFRQTDALQDSLSCQVFVSIKTAYHPLWCQDKARNDTFKLTSSCIIHVCSCFYRTISIAPQNGQDHLQAATQMRAIATKSGFIMHSLSTGTTGQAAHQEPAVTSVGLPPPSAGQGAAPHDAPSCADSESDTVERLLRCPLTKVSALNKRLQSICYTCSQFYGHELYALQHAPAKMHSGHGVGACSVLLLFCSSRSIRITA